MGTFVLEHEQPKPAHQYTTQRGLAKAVLLKNARWFTRIRWMACAALGALALASHFAPDVLRSCCIVPPTHWPWRMALGIACTNLGFIALVHQLTPASSRFKISVNIWFQTFVDMAFLTVLIHLVGALDTFIAFTYLFHIVLACIFFIPKVSLAITLVASGLYLSLVAIELAGVINPQSIFETGPHVIHMPCENIIHAASAVGVWLVVWYLVSALSKSVRKRDRHIVEANRKLIEADKEKNLLVLRTTHDLKAPFSGIESNIQVLNFVHGDALSEPVKELVDRIARRAETLRERIRDILVLGELRSEGDASVAPRGVALKKVFETIYEDLEEKAESREIVLNFDVPEILVEGNTQQLAILFGNLAANALFYSRDGGTVTVSVDARDEEVKVRVIDKGIGIDEDALPHIFDEYYRTVEAAEHNKLSTGLGLAIVRKIADKLDLDIAVTSVHGEGTTFEVTLKRSTTGAGEDQGNGQDNSN